MLVLRNWRLFHFFLAAGPDTSHAGMATALDSDRWGPGAHNKSRRQVRSWIARMVPFHLCDCVVTRASRVGDWMGVPFAHRNRDRLGPGRSC